MLYAILGNDRDKAGKKARELVMSLREKKPDASYLAIGDEELTESRLVELLGGQGLFENKLIVF